jgi:hypothetical protein
VAPGTSASFLDTKLFTVELGNDPVIPEPGSATLVAFAVLAVLIARRARS